MAYLSKYGAIDQENPEPRGRCDRGGEIRKLSELKPEYEYRGLELRPNGFLCCDQHRDKPHPPWIRPKSGPDPEPVDNPRPHLEARLYRRVMQAADGTYMRGPDGNWLLLESASTEGRPVILSTPDGDEYLTAPDGSWIQE
jgi:hypothetical protein